MSVLQRCDGPECPHCGCNQAEILQEPRAGLGVKSWFGSGRARCGHCRRVFSFRELPAPPEIPPEPEPPDQIAAPPPILEPPPKTTRRTIEVVECPDCGSTMRVVRTAKKVRYHKCPACGRTSKTVRSDFIGSVPVLEST